MSHMCSWPSSWVNHHWASSNHTSIRRIGSGPFTSSKMHKYTTHSYLLDNVYLHVAVEWLSLTETPLITCRKHEGCGTTYNIFRCVGYTQTQTHRHRHIHTHACALTQIHACMYTYITHRGDECKHTSHTQMHAHAPHTPDGQTQLKVSISQPCFVLGELSIHILQISSSTVCIQW